MKTRNQLLNKLFLTLLLTGCFVLFIGATNPDNVPLPLLIVPFILLGFILYQLVCSVFLLIKGRQNTSSIRIVASSIACLAVGLLLLQSLHQLTWRDSLLGAVFAILFWLYVWRADFLKK